MKIAELMRIGPVIPVVVIDDVAQAVPLARALVAGGAGFHTLKLFPAQQAGGIGMLKALHGPFPDVSFCPTGGVSAASAHEFLALPNVGCVGGSWLTPSVAIKAGDWGTITALARAAATLRDSAR